jgi:photosystem II stability/assembly factor-like uncharacterized protein
MRLLVIPLLAGLLAASVVFSHAPTLRAQERQSARWELLTVHLSTLGQDDDDNAVQAIFGPPSGPLFVRLKGGVFRSDDAGDTWTRLPIPRGMFLETVDPLDASVVYVTQGNQLSRSRDQGATLEPLLQVRTGVVQVAVSPADPRVIYVGLPEVGRPGDEGEHSRLLRSQDGGGTWEPIGIETNTPHSLMYSDLLVPHSIAPDRVFYQISHGVTGDVDAPLRHSIDRGSTWQSVLVTRNTLHGLVGGEGVQPRRFYTFDRDAAIGSGAPTSSGVFRSDDDGASWHEVSRIRDGFISELAYDPRHPDRVWVGIYAAGTDKLGVWSSADRGETWTDLNSRQLGAISSLLLGIDGRNLYAGTRQGLWRLHLEPDADS